MQSLFYRVQEILSARTMYNKLGNFGTLPDSFTRLQSVISGKKKKKIKHSHGSVFLYSYTFMFMQYFLIPSQKLLSESEKLWERCKSDTTNFSTGDI